MLIRRNPQTLTEELVEFSPRGAVAHEAKHDLPLRSYDRIIIYPSTQTGERRLVSIEGAVTAPGAFAYIGEMRVQPSAVPSPRVCARMPTQSVPTCIACWPTTA